MARSESRGRVRVRSARKLGGASEPERRVRQADVVANKRLGAVLAQIQKDQQERDRQRLASPKLTLRQKEQIPAAQARATAAPSPAAG